MSGMTTQGVKLAGTLRNRLKQLSGSKDRSTHWLIKTAITEYLERQERAERERREDEKRWARYEKAGHFINNDKAMAWLDDLSRGTRRPCPR